MGLKCKTRERDDVDVFVAELRMRNGKRETKNMSERKNAGPGLGTRPDWRVIAPIGNGVKSTLSRNDRQCNCTPSVSTAQRLSCKLPMAARLGHDDGMGA